MDNIEFSIEKKGGYGFSAPSMIGVSPDYAPLWKSTLTYAADACCVHNGYLWRNTSGAASTGVEPGTNYNVWNVTYANENLLDNPWFTVNQRGVESIANKGYFVDRWFSSNTNAAHSITDNVITLGNTGAGNSFLRQFFGKPLTPGRTYTLSFVIKGTAKGYISVNRSDTNIIGGTAAINGTFSNWTVVTKTLTIPNDELDAALCSIRCDSTFSYQIKAAKLELGSVSTLAQDTTPNYQQELAKCQRFYQRYETFGGYYSIITYGLSWSSTTARLVFDLPVAMRPSAPSATETLPRLTVSDVSTLYIRDSAGTTNATVVSMETGKLFINDTSKIRINATVDGGLTAAAPCFLRNSANVVLEFSSEPMG